jgi:all-trans-retinol 13,14-reductase
MESKKYLTYKKEEYEDDKFDVIVIGSGTGGLSVSSILAQEGKRVLLLEQHYVIGGYSHAFQRKGYMWDVGLHYVGQVNTPGTVLNKTFNYISKGGIKWAELDDVYDRALFGTDEYEFPSGKENFRKKLKYYFPGEVDAKSIDDYFELLDEVKKVGLGFYAEKVIPPFLANIFGTLMRRGVMKYSDQTTLSVMQKISKNEKLIGVLTAQYGDYGLQPSQSSFYMHAVVVNHYMDGAGYPIGGAPMLAETIVPVIEDAGGVVLSSAMVKQVIVENNVAVGVEMEDGGKFFAKSVVSDAGVINTFSSLLEQKVIDQHGLDKELEKLEPSLAHMGLYVGINEPTEGLNLPKCNYWIFPDEYNHALNQERYKSFDSELPVAFASFPSAKDPDSEKHYPGKTTAEVIILIPFDWFKKWSNLDRHKKGDDYKKLKEQIGEQMFEQLYRVAPQLKGKVDYYEISSPLSARHYVGHPSGEIYGVAHTPSRFRQRFLKCHTPVKNLYMTGQDAMIASISGGVMGGVLCASAILKKNILWKIKRKIKG